MITQSNTTTVNPVASSVAANPVNVPSALAANPVIAEANQTVANLRAELAVAEQHLEAEKAALAAAALEKQRAIIDSIPGQLGVATIKEAIALLGGVKAKDRSFPNRLPEETLAQAKVMLQNGATSRAVSEALKMGLSTVDLWKSRWGLTKPRPKAQAKAKGTVHRFSPQSGHLSPAKRARIVEALKRPNARVAVVAKRFGTSRQTTYSIRASIPELRIAA